MLFELLTGYIDIFTFLIWLVALAVAVTIHEFAHAFSADRLGDPTPRYQGRLTLNPRAHFDPIGTLFILLFSFGWGRPVPFNPENLSNPKRDTALIALAGPSFNLILAAILGVCYRLFGGIFIIFWPIIALNINLAVFNLLPIFPLDGEKIALGLLPYPYALSWEKFKIFGIWILFLLMMMPWGGGSVLTSIIRPAIHTIFRLFTGTEIPLV